MRKCDCYFDKLEHEGKVFFGRNFKLQNAQLGIFFGEQDALLEIKENDEKKKFPGEVRNNSEWK